MRAFGLYEEVGEVDWWESQLTIPLHTDRIKLIGESVRLLAAGERGRYAASFSRLGRG